MKLYKKILNKISAKRTKIQTNEIIKQLRRGTNIKKSGLNYDMDMIDNKDTIYEEYNGPNIKEPRKRKNDKMNLKRKILRTKRIDRMENSGLSTDEQLITAFLLEQSTQHLRKLKNVFLVTQLVEENINVDLKLKCAGYLIEKDLVEKMAISKDCVNIKYILKSDEGNSYNKENDNNSGNGSVRVINNNGSVRVINNSSGNESVRVINNSSGNDNNISDLKVNESVRVINNISDLNFINKDCKNNGKITTVEINGSIDKIFKILTNCDKLVILKISVSLNEIYHFIETMVVAEPCAYLSKAIESIILSIAHSDRFNFKMLLNIYLKIKTAYLNRDFINKFFDSGKTGNISTVRLLKAKELFKLYKRTDDPAHLRSTSRAVRRLNRKRAREARFKICMYLCDYTNALEHADGPNKFIALGEIDPEYSLELLLRENRLNYNCNLVSSASNNNSVGSIKRLFAFNPDQEKAAIDKLCHLESCLVAPIHKKPHREKTVSPYLEIATDLLCQLGESPLKLFLLSQQKMPDSLALKLRILRYLKHNNISVALQYGTLITRLRMYNNPIFHLIVYELSIIYRKVGLDFISFLYRARRKMNVSLFAQEIAFFEGRTYKHSLKDKEFEDNYSALFLAKKIVRNSHNYTSDSRKKCKFISNNGDYAILRYLCDRDLAIKRIVDHLEITEGFYWKQLVGIVDFEKKLKLGIELILFDFGN